MPRLASRGHARFPPWPPPLPSSRVRGRRSRQATATADGWYVPPGEAISGGHVVTVRLVAYDLGTCNGKYAYRRMNRYLPSLGQRFHPTGDDRLICQ
jgi:hypothetical protein